jgi:hypothetical protein
MFKGTSALSSDSIHVLIAELELNFTSLSSPHEGISISPSYANNTKSVPWQVLLSMHKINKDVSAKFMSYFSRSLRLFER